MRAASSRATALETHVIVKMPSLLPACVQATPEAKKMPPPNAPTSSHRLRIGRILGAGFDRRLLALWQVHARRLRPAGRITCTCRVQVMIGRGGPWRGEISHSAHLEIRISWFKEFLAPLPRFLAKLPGYMRLQTALQVLQVRRSILGSATEALRRGERHMTHPPHRG